VGTFTLYFLFGKPLKGFENFLKNEIDLFFFLLRDRRFAIHTHVLVYQKPSKFKKKPVSTFIITFSGSESFIFFLLLLSDKLVAVGIRMSKRGEMSDAHQQERSFFHPSIVRYLF